MYTATRHDFGSKQDLYFYLAEQLRALIAGERDWIANLANCSALLFDTLSQVNWVGFYLLRKSERGSELVVGPFQGKPACVRIALGRGVCGTAAEQRRSVIVPNVHEFPGHIACDSASNSEIVVPLLRGEQLIGVLDIDSPVLNRFDEEDQAGLEQLTAILLEGSSDA